MPSSRLTTLEGEIDRVFDWGLRLAGDERVYRFSKYGAPRPEGLAPGDAVRLEVAPGTDGLPTWIKTVAFGADPPPPIAFPPELDAVMADLDAAAGEGVAAREDTGPSALPASALDGGVPDDDPFAGLPVAGPVGPTGAAPIVSRGIPDAAPTRGPAGDRDGIPPPAPALRGALPNADGAAPLPAAVPAEDIAAVTELLAQAVDELRALRQLAEAQAKATDALELAVVGALSLLGDRVTDAVAALGVDLVALFGSRMATTGLPSDGPGADAAAQHHLDLWARAVPARVELDGADLGGDGRR
jgi:hypothetical protein